MAGHGLRRFMGVESLLANPLFQRVSLLFTQPRLYPPDHVIRHMRPMKVRVVLVLVLVWCWWQCDDGFAWCCGILQVHLYTIIQFAWLGACWVVKGTKVISTCTMCGGFRTWFSHSWIVDCAVPHRSVLPCCRHEYGSISAQGPALDIRC